MESLDMSDSEMKGAIVYVVDDDTSVRESIALMLRSRRLIAQSFASAQIFFDTVIAPLGDQAADFWPGEPSALILDMRMPGMTGLMLFERLAELQLISRLPVIFLTAHSDVQTAVKVVKRGAADYVEKPLNAEDLFKLVEGALRTSDGALSRQRQAERKQEQLRAIIEKLTPQEGKVIQYTLQGLTSKDIAERMPFSFRTVERYRQRACQKLNVSSHMQLAYFFHEQGIDPAVLDNCRGDD
jgi:two-component system response regulator DctR